MGGNGGFLLWVEVSRHLATASVSLAPTSDPLARTLVYYA